MLRTIGVAALTLVVGFGLGLAKDAGADQARATVTVATKTPVSCLLALESAWKTINQTPADGIDHKADFDTQYNECLQAS
ncbi:MAG: hypothetical protein LC792_16915 [Actinobacteria bacterium]|nr:hypothetical protein [Actinomycetota bacterium]